MSTLKLSKMPGYESFIKPFVQNQIVDDKAAAEAISTMMSLTRAGIGIEIDEELIPGAMFQLDYRDAEGLKLFVLDVATVLDGQEMDAEGFDLGSVPERVAKFDRDIYKAAWLATGRRFEDIFQDIEGSREAAILAGNFAEFLRVIMRSTEEGFMGERRNIDPETQLVESVENAYYVHEQGGFASQWTYKGGPAGEVLAHREFRRMLLRLNPDGSQLTRVNLSRMKVV